VILCERGIRTFETATRNTLDLSAVPVSHSLTHLPVVVDPSHATGVASSVRPMASAAVAAGASPRSAAAAERSDATSPSSASTSSPPIANPGKIICVGVNYGHRNEEYKDGSAPPQYPSVFPRFPESFVGHGQPSSRPPESEQLDYEGEIAIV
ncbi:hypothetical protein OY671_012251, partial [Metschnikowia pulcherrima]